MTRRYGVKFVWLVAIPLIFASTCIGLLTFDLLQRLSTDANTADHNHTAKMVESAFKSEANNLAGIVADNATWDDAATHVVEKLDVDWAESTWRASTESDLYDQIFVVAANSDVPEIGYSKGVPLQPKLAEYFGTDWFKINELLPRDPKSFQTVSSIVQKSNGLAIVSVAQVAPTTERLIATNLTKKFLVMVKDLNDQRLAAIGEQYVVEDLQLKAKSQTSNDGLAIKTIDGRTIAFATWTDKRPGDLALKAAFKNAGIALGVFLTVMAGICFLCWGLMKNIAKREYLAVQNSTHDALTGLHNRLALLAHIDHLLQKSDTTFSIAFVDLDGFKDVNDTYDHDTGDRLLIAVASGFAFLTQRSGFLARLGGDEFVVLFEGSDSLAQASHFASQVISLLVEPFNLNGRFAKVGASIGIAINENASLTSNETMRRADAAMYEAKRLGKNQFAIYTESLEVARVENQQIIDELRQIVSAGMIEVMYQPIVDARTKAIVAVEALARWPKNSILQPTPDKFIAIAEMSGQIAELGQLILSKACCDAAQWPNVRLSVNVSPVQMRDPGFVERALACIKFSGIAPGRVEFEITEGVKLDDLETVLAQFAQMRVAGISIAMDDFGVGYSNISNMKALGFDRVKIDRSLVSNALGMPNDQKILQAAVLMASGIAAKVTAEGVENAEYSEVLRLAGCDELQGYYFHKPQPASAISDLLNVGFTGQDMTTHQAA